MKNWPAAARYLDRPLSRFPLRGKAGAGGFPPRRDTCRASTLRWHAPCGGSPHKRGCSPPLCIPRREGTLQCKPDISLANKTGHLDVLPTDSPRLDSPGIDVGDQGPLRADAGGLHAALHSYTFAHCFEIYHAHSRGDQPFSKPRRAFLQQELGLRRGLRVRSPGAHLVAVAITT